jgi:hypothetical protein
MHKPDLVTGSLSFQLTAPQLPLLIFGLGQLQPNLRIPLRTWMTLPPPFWRVQLISLQAQLIPFYGPIRIHQMLLVITVPKNQQNARTTYPTHFDEKVVYVSDEPFTPATRGRSILLPRFIRLPISVTVPVGLVFDPRDISFARFQALVAFTCYGNDLAATSCRTRSSLLGMPQRAFARTH